MYGTRGQGDPLEGLLLDYAFITPDSRRRRRSEGRTANRLELAKGPADDTNRTGANASADFAVAGFSL